VNSTPQGLPPPPGDAKTTHACENDRISYESENENRETSRELVQPPLVDVVRSIPQLSGPSSFANSSALVPRIVSYNVNGLSYYATDSDGVFRKNLVTRAVTDFLPKCDIICLQETNLTRAEKFCFSALPGCVVSLNNSKKNTAGTLIIDSPNILKHYKPEDVLLPPNCAGFVQCRRYLPLSDSHKPFQLFNCYFFTGADKFSVQASLIDGMISIPNLLPTFLGGDFNFIENLGDSSSANPSLPPSSFLDKFLALKEHFSISEAPHSEHTHFHYTSDVNSPFSYSSRLDRFFVPSFLSPSLTHDVSVSIIPHSTNYRPQSPGTPRRHFSDHLPVFLSFSTDENEISNRPNIPLWLASSPEFSAALHDIWKPPLHGKSPFKLLSKYKGALFKAASRVRTTKVLQTSLCLSLSQHISLLHLISLLVQDTPRISLLLARAPSLSKLVSLRGDRYVDSGLEISARNLLVEASSPPSPSPLPHPISALKDKLPGSKARVPHLRDSPSDEPCFSAKGKSRIASKFWSEVWSPRVSPPSRLARSNFLRGYTKRVNTSLLSSPSLDDVLSAIKRSNNSASGPDGIPFAAWRAAPELAGPLLVAVLDILCSGQPPPAGFNFGLLFLIPKKHTGLVTDTRPISVTNTDNRLLASTMASAMMPAVSELVEPCQKGFLWGKNGLDHTLAINEYFFEGVKKKIQRLCFFLDTAKAFDSIDHDWALHVLAKAGFPPWVISFVKGSLHDVRVSPCFGKELVDWIDIRRGVKQGCPLSPLIFIIAYDPLLFSLSKLPYISRFAFADDLAITADSIPAITPALHLITRFSALSGLGINRDKSCVLSSAPDTTWDTLRAQLRGCPWPDLPLRDSTTHLGIPIGSKITLGDIFESPYKKAVARLVGSKPLMKGLPVSSRILFVNTFVISLFSYHFLFFVIPKEFYSSIKSLIIKLVTPFNGGAYTYESLLCLNFIFSIRPPLKDLWAVNISLLAARSPYIHSNSNYNDLPKISLAYSKFIIEHRDAAAIDFWRDRHIAESGILTPLLKCTSPCIYQAMIEDVYLFEAATHIGKKVASFVSSNFPDTPSLHYTCVESISSALSFAARGSPASFLFHHFAFLNNALATSRRMRHQNKISIDDVAKCFFCNNSEDSIVHIYCFCPVIHRARSIFFRRCDKFDLLLSLFPSYDSSSCFPFPLALSLLIDVPHKLCPHFLAFNYAVWKFRVPSQGTSSEMDDAWRSNRVAELASTYFTRTKSPKKRLPPSSDESVISHDTILTSALSSDLICYTDGSASPNPGPAGAGASIFNLTTSTVTDLGTPLGFGTNNLGELAAIGLCLSELVSLYSCSSFRPSHIFLFTDSLYASNAVTSRTLPVAHATSISSLRLLFSSVARLAPITLHWIRGHSGAGGNERVDKIAKRYAKLSPNSPLPPPVTFPAHKSVVPWPFDICTAPLQAFLYKLPSAVFPTLFVSPVSVASSQTLVESSPPILISRTHSMRLRDRPSAPPAPPQNLFETIPLVRSSFPPPARGSRIARLFNRLTPLVPAQHSPTSVSVDQCPESRARPSTISASSDSDSDHMDRKHSD
jgi:ribonuclease HI/exonuclease III